MRGQLVEQQIYVGLPITAVDDFFTCTMNAQFMFNEPLPADLFVSKLGREISSNMIFKF